MSDATDKTIHAASGSQTISNSDGPETYGEFARFASNAERLRDMPTGAQPRSSSSASEIIHQLRAFGPDHVPAWEQLSNVNRLCNECAHISWDPVYAYLAVADEYSWFPKLPWYRAGRSVKEVRDGAHAGCHLCTIILTCLLTMRYRLSIGVDPLPWGLSSINESSTVSVDVEVMAHDPPVYLTVGIAEESKSTDYSVQDQSGVDQWIDLSIPICSELPQTSSSVSTANSAESIAQSWLHECLTNHKRCTNDVPVLPTRILDVSSRTEPFLVIPEGKRARYATLSYSVGQYNLLKTTKENIDTHKSGIPFVKLPQTVRDAVELTRVLGLQYLWIDSLCIDQSSLTDWEMELSTMAEIYRNATITIAATASTNAGTGCTPTRNKLPLAPCHPAPGIVILPDYGRDKWIFQKGALETRAWTYQEIQLSRRILRCGGEELAWQCRTCKRREGDPAVERVHDTNALATFFGTRTLDDLKNTTNKKDMFFRWYQVIQEFFPRNLSFPEDKLPAFSGMASHFAAFLGDGKASTYLSGLWLSDLLHGLCWRTIHSSGRLIPYRAPSWSWAAIEAEKIVYNMYALRNDDFYTEVLDVTVTVPGLNAYGRVTSGKLTLLGLLAPIPSQIHGDDSEIGPWEWHWPLLTFDQTGEPPLRCSCLRLQTGCCLILSMVDNTWRPGVYRRVGMLVMPTEQEDPRQVKMEILDSLEWKQEILTII